MEASELRIGNWVDISYKDDEQDQHQVTGTTERGAVWFVPDPSSFECAFSINQIKPIPLTEEWLVKFGFRKYKNGYIITPSMGLDYGYVIEHYEWRGDWALGILYYDPVRDCDIDEVYNFCGTGLKHVHQLQNIYHALTGEELQ
jgi:hypothetical protein